MESLWQDGAPSFVDDSSVPAKVDDLVVGAGLTGLTTAVLLARAGRRVAVVEARRVGAVTTGNTSAKVSLLQGTKLSVLLRSHDRRVAEAYLASNRGGQQWLTDFCADHGVPVQMRDAVTYASTADERDVVRREHEAARSLGLGVRWQDRLDVPFPNHGATVLAAQAQFNPLDVLAALVEQLREHGGTLHQGHRLTGVSWTGPPVATLRLEGAGGDGDEDRDEDRDEDGGQDGCGDGGRDGIPTEVSVEAAEVVLATGVPVLDRGLYFAKVEPQRSYVLAFAFAESLGGMYLSAGTSSRSVRDAPGAAGAAGHLLVGGSGHGVGRTRSEQAHVDELHRWTEEHYPGARLTHQWSAQDYSPSDGLPRVELLPRGRGRIHVATGFDKWGMTNGVAAARTIASRILGDAPQRSTAPGRPGLARPGLARPGLTPPALAPRSAARMLEMNLRGVAANLSTFVRAEIGSEPEQPPEGQGRVGRSGLLPRGVSTVDGRPCSVTAVCTHAGGTLTWNDAERTWDCPWHGSRFSPHGSVLEGPATRPLNRPDRADRA
ncbi:FAD-dependent oxidoreductase [Nocardioides sp. JQ2195]|uniref:FAD-dependent oxidoreductase n=1 Tax=Nocardioides sp. JQ2195 TaxID=2592334 RepID=UPI00143EEC48|nr:FAD-dependent oxidoreductase [Nocardioides sp. JQ2195]QIX25864.1 FAD-dependent oxidoreductase [Nocardioides sp. JQ2195]